MVSNSRRRRAGKKAWSRPSGWNAKIRVLTQIIIIIPEQTFFSFSFFSLLLSLFSLSLFSSVFVSATSASFASVLVARAGQGRKGRVRGGSSSLPEMLQPTRAL